MTGKKLLGILFCLLIVGCDGIFEKEPSTGFISFSTNGEIVYEEFNGGVINTSIDSDTGSKVIEVTDHDGTIDLSVSSSSDRDVYFVFTNTNQEESLSIPEISSKLKSASKLVSEKTSELDVEDITELRRKSNETIANFNEDPFQNAVKPSVNKSIFASTPSYSSSYEEGDSEKFYDDSNNTENTIAATMRKTITVNGTTLNVWVADDSWDHEEYPITQTMVDSLVYKFLRSGDNNDIYDWVTNICGEQWGSHASSYFIDDTDEIDILLFDIDGDGLESGGKTYGYFYARDNFVQESIETSNEKVMFYIDAPIFANTEDDEWSISGSYQQDIISTLAHEFQHMINFYQKVVKNGTSSGSDSWLNELSSMAVEDLLSTKISSAGPRGVNYSDGSAGSSNNTDGRLPLYNLHNQISLTTWSGDSENSDEVYYDYAINYAFGAYMIRNFGGAKFVKEIVQNDKTNYEAINDALTELGYTGYTFDTVFHKFATANLLSEFTNAPDKMQFNTGTWFTSQENNETYSLGSINLYNYKYSTCSGPNVCNGELDLLLPCVSNLLYHVGTIEDSGSISVSEIEDDMKVSIVIK